MGEFMEMMMRSFADDKNWVFKTVFILERLEARKGLGNWPVNSLSPPFNQDGLMSLLFWFYLGSV